MIDQDYVDDAEDLTELPTIATLKDLSDLVIKMLSLRSSVEELTAHLKAETAKLASIAEHELPNLFNDLRMKEFVLDDGTKVGVKTKIVSSVLADDRPVFFDWMHKNGFGTLVKREVAVLFGRGDLTKAGKLRGYLRRWYKDFVVNDAEGIHGGTLNAWVREIEAKNEVALENGGRVLDFPEVLKITHLREAVVTPPKKKGGL